VTELTVLDELPVDELPVLEKSSSPVGLLIIPHPVAIIMIAINRTISKLFNILLLLVNLIVRCTPKVVPI
jgi:hypothetical protein